MIVTIHRRDVVRDMEVSEVLGRVWLEGGQVRWDAGAEVIVRAQPWQGLTPEDGPEFLEALWSSLSGTHVYATREDV